MRRERRPSLHIRWSLRVLVALYGGVQEQHCPDSGPGRSRQATGSRSLVDAWAMDCWRGGAILDHPGVEGAALSPPDSFGRPSLRELLAWRWLHSGHLG